MTTSTDSISVQAAKEHPLPTFEAGQTIGGRYSVVEKLGEGMLGAVYKVKHDRTGEVLALKILREKLVAEEVDADRFDHEMQVPKSLAHPAVVKLLDTGEHEGVLFYTMAFVPGPSVRDLMVEYRSKGEDFPPARAHRIISNVLDVLQETHAVALHRDLKPENIKVGSGDSVKLLDYGVARVISPTIFADAQLNREGAWYLAPEMSEFRDLAAGPNSDLYSLGAIFYEMLTGVPPVGRYEMPSELTHGEVSEKIDDLVEIALAPNPQDRFRSAADMSAAMRQSFSDLYSGGQTSLRAALIAIMVLVVILGALSVYFKQAEPTPEELKAVEMERRTALRAQIKAAYTSPAKAPKSGDKYETMVWIPPGPFLEGAFKSHDDGLAGEKVEAIVEVGGFFIDKHPLRHEEGANQGKPVTNLTWNEAESACKAQGKRLCTEEEWEKACKGPETNSYVYGNEFDPKRCPLSGYFAPGYSTEQYGECVGQFLVYGMSGGALEWTASERAGKYVVKGAAIGNEEKGTRCAGRADRAPNFSQIHIGARCCAD